MRRLLLLDAGPLGLVTIPRESEQAMEARRWQRAQVARGAQAPVSDIADYEVRRELLRAGRHRGIEHLDELRLRFGSLPVTAEVMAIAATYWAEARRRGRPTALDDDLDCDVSLSAQATIAAREGDEVIIATTNIRHLSLFADARHWREIA